MRLLFVLCLFSGFFNLSAQDATPKPRPHHIIGLTGGYQWGDVKVNNLNELYGDFASTESAAFGGFIRFTINRQFYLRAEYLHVERLLKGYYSDVFISTYPIELKQQINDAVLIVQYAPFKKMQKFAPFIGAGFGIGFSSPDYLKVEKVSSGILLAPLDFRINSDDTQGIGELGFHWQIAPKISVALSGRYYLSANSFNFNIAPDRVDSRSVRLDRMQGLLSVGYTL
jgi:hypothetical protein